MLETTMYVRCTHCGYDNSPEYRFCGMCGASLAHPPIAAKTVVKEATTPAAESTPAREPSNGSETVHGPSFLGLAEDPKTEFHYLYEDEPPRSYAGLIFVLVLLVAVGGFGYWQWRHNGFPFNRISALNKPPNQSGSPSEVAPAQSQEQQTNIPRPMTGAGDAPASQNQSATPQTGTTTDIPAQGGQNPPTGTATNSPAGSQPATEEKPPANTSTNSDEGESTPPAAEPAAHAKSRPKPRTETATKPAPAETATAPAVPDTDLEQAGERYLYGNGLPQNCSRANSALSTAATHGNSKAQTVLGTMYATGHCVGRDLPTAYRWFARALHQEPQNARISEDLQVLWRQMTPQEKQLATTSGQ